MGGNFESVVSRLFEEMTIGNIPAFVCSLESINPALRCCHLKKEEEEREKQPLNSYLLPFPMQVQ